MAGLARTRLAKSVCEAGWSSFISMLEYKAERYGRTLVRIGRFEPTSQTCSTCVKDGPESLNVGKGPVPPAAPSTTGTSTPRNV